MKLPRSSHAVAWMLADPENRTQSQAAEKFNLSQGAISQRIKRERPWLACHERLGPVVMGRAIEYLESSPVHTWKGASSLCELPRLDMWSGIAGHYIKQLRSIERRNVEQYIYAPRESDTERAARIALELCGPGLGDVVAAAIRAK